MIVDPRITNVTGSRDEWNKFWHDRMDDMRRDLPISPEDFERLLQIHDACWPQIGDDE